MYSNTLITWLGNQDILQMGKDQNGPLAAIILKGEVHYDNIVILVNDWLEQNDDYEKWITKKSISLNRQAEIEIREAEIASPIDYQSIGKFTNEVISSLTDNSKTITINITSGTPAMTAISVLLGKGIYNCKFVQSSIHNNIHKIEKTVIPFDFKATYKQYIDKKLSIKASSSPKIESAFENIICHSSTMSECSERAKRLAQTNLPVLILGNSGTGKETMANAIHKGSDRSSKPIKAVNCGAISESLIDSILFGHAKGAFTGATTERKGLFEQAHNGIIFLDEVGELSPSAQVKLLRVLQEGEITKVGADITNSVDVRVIAATHRNLQQMIRSGEFREDLYYRLAVGVITVPSLHERGEDIADLLVELVKEVNQTIANHPTLKCKEISNDVIIFTQNHNWPGNIRELWNTLNRAFLWSDGEVLSLADFKSAMIIDEDEDNDEKISLSYDSAINLQQLLDNTTKLYINEALRLYGNNKSKTAEMLGFSNHQTLQNWMKRVGID